MDDISVQDHRDALVARLNNARKTYENCMAGVVPEVANRGSEWSITDLLRHVNADGLYRNMTVCALEEESPVFEGYNAAARLQQLVETTLAQIDEALHVATTVTVEELARTGTRQGRTYAAIDSLELWVAHFEEHLSQLQNEIRPREGLPGVEVVSFV